MNEHLTDSNNLKLFSNPIILKEGKTSEGDNNILTNDFVENKLIAKICEILRNNKGNLKIEYFNKIKQLLKDEKTDNYYINPIVITNGINKSEIIEGKNDSKNYKNIAIKNIITDIKELFEDNFFIFDALKLKDFNVIKQLLKDEKTGNYYINPIVIAKGINKGETIEGNNDI